MLIYNLYTTFNDKALIRINGNIDYSSRKEIMEIPYRYFLCFLILINENVLSNNYSFILTIIFHLAIDWSNKCLSVFTIATSISTLGVLLVPGFVYLDSAIVIDSTGEISICRSVCHDKFSSIGISPNMLTGRNSDSTVRIDGCSDRRIVFADILINTIDSNGVFTRYLDKSFNTFTRNCCRY